MICTTTDCPALFTRAAALASAGRAGRRAPSGRGVSQARRAGIGLLGLALWLLTGAAAAARPATAAATASAPASAPALSLSAIARLLAGIDPGSREANAGRITASAAWRQHQAAAQAGGHRLRLRLKHMDLWQAQHIAAAAHGRPLVYPFSGPDFINAYALFPDAPSYVFFSLEPIGAVPALEQLSSAQQAHLYGDLRTALNDLVALNFFITPNMKQKLQTDALQGTIPVLLAMLGLLDLQVDAVDAYDPWPELALRYSANGQAQARPALLAQGVRIAFTNPRSHQQQELIYLSMDVSDAALKYYPDFLPWMAGFPGCAVLLKSASYLLHGSHFRRLRGAILKDASLIVQDDTGLPYKMVVEAGFAVTLFGQYERPVKLFAQRYQNDLDTAYARAADQNALPFPFGYNWRKQGRSGLLLALRPPATP